MRGVLKAMFLAKLKATAVLLAAALVLGAGGVAFHAGSRPAAASAAEAGPGEKAPADAEALRQENELLKLNLRVVLEKVRAQEAEIKDLKSQARAAAFQGAMPNWFLSQGQLDLNNLNSWGVVTGPSDTMWFNPHEARLQGEAWRRFIQASPAAPDPLQEAEAALKALREARNREARQQAADSLERALKKLREQRK
jgi:hypothetical protein